MKTITLLNEKGGVGKTTLAVHIAAGLALMGKRVVLIDADAQGHAAVALNQPKAPHFYDWMVRESTRWENVLARIPDARICGGVVPGEMYLMAGNIETRGIPGMISTMDIIRQRLNEVADVIDVVVFDTSPTPSLLHGAIYMATDHILFPVIPAALAIDGLMESTRHHSAANAIRREYGMDDIKVSGIIPTKYKSGHNAHDFGLTVLMKQFKNQVWGPLPERTVWEQASYAKKTLFAYAPESDAAQHAWAVVERVARTMGAER